MVNKSEKYEPTNSLLTKQTCISKTTTNDYFVMVPDIACLVERNTIPFQIVKETVDRNKVYSTVVNRNCISQSLMKINQNRPKSANIKDILNFAMRRMSVTKREVLTDQMVCPMIKDMFLEVWLTSYFNVNFYFAKVTKQYESHKLSYI